jgi:hypothetical protein
MKLASKFIFSGRTSVSGDQDASHFGVGVLPGPTRLGSCW